MRTVVSQLTLADLARLVQLQQAVAATLPAGYDAELPFPLVPAEEWALHAGDLGNTMVLPARGRGLQRALIEARIAHAITAAQRCKR